MKTKSKSKSSKNLDSKSAKKFSVSASSTDWTPTPDQIGVCRVGVPFMGCGRGATCWRYRVSTDNWNGNGICVTNGRCLPRNTWVSYSAWGENRMERECCNGTMETFWDFRIICA